MIYLLSIAVFIVWVGYLFLEGYLENKKFDLNILKNKIMYGKGIILVILECILIYYNESNINLLFNTLTIFIIFIVSQKDIKEKRISNKILIILFAICSASVYFINRDNLLNIGVAFVATTIILMLLSKFSKEALGYGDAKLLSILALYYGLEGILTVLFLASLLVALIGVFYLIKSFSNRKKEIPFAPFILVACMIVNVMQ
jgi:leader peptidase (prepilin peptidase)/N-methyltransferase